MEYEFKLPDVGEGLVEAEIVRWLVAVGDRVVVDQSIVEVETAKALAEITTPVAGVIAQLGSGEGQVLQVGQTLVTVEIDAIEPEAGESGSGHSPRILGSEPALTPHPGHSPTPPKAGLTPAHAARQSRALASPSTRKAAQALGVDLDTVTGTGPHGRVTRADVEAIGAQRSASREEPEPLRTIPRAGARRPDSADTTVPLRGTRRVIAESMSRSWREIPHVTEFREIDAANLVAARRVLAAEYDDKSTGRHLTFLPLMVASCVRALRRYREFNASVDMAAKQITYRGSADIGIATSTGEGLVAPVLRAAHQLTLFEIADRIAELTRLTRARRARPEDLTGGSFTITNFGSYGTWLGTPVINPPQSAIAGFGRIQDRPAVVSGELVVRTTLPVVVAADHRIIDGSELGAFVNQVARYLTDPVLLLAGEG